MHRAPTRERSLSWRIGAATLWRSPCTRQLLSGQPMTKRLTASCLSRHQPYTAGRLPVVLIGCGLPVWALPPRRRCSCTVTIRMWLTATGRIEIWPSALPHWWQPNPPRVLRYSSPGRFLLIFGRIFVYRGGACGAACPVRVALFGHRQTGTKERNE